MSICPPLKRKRVDGTPPPPGRGSSGWSFPPTVYLWKGCEWPWPIGWWWSIKAIIVLGFFFFLLLFSFLFLSPPFLPSRWWWWWYGERGGVSDFLSPRTTLALVPLQVIIRPIDRPIVASGWKLCPSLRSSRGPVDHWKHTNHEKVHVRGPPLI